MGCHFLVKDQYSGSAACKEEKQLAAGGKALPGQLVLSDLDFYWVVAAFHPFIGRGLALLEIP